MRYQKALLDKNRKKGKCKESLLPTIAFWENEKEFVEQTWVKGKVVKQAWLCII